MPCTSDLAVGFAIGTTTLFRHIREALDVLAAMVPTFRDVIDIARRKAFVILDGTLQGMDRCACLVLATVATSPPVCQARLSRYRRRGRPLP